MEPAEQWKNARQPRKLVKPGEGCRTTPAFRRKGRACKLLGRTFGVQSLRGFHQEPGRFAGVARKCVPNRPFSRGQAVPEVLLSRLRCKTLDYTAAPEFNPPGRPPGPAAGRSPVCTRPVPWVPRAPPEGRVRVSALPVRRGAGASSRRPVRPVLSSGRCPA